jgi:cell division septation protein DedD
MSRCAVAQEEVVRLVPSGRLTPNGEFTLPAMNTTTNDPPKFELSIVQLIAGCLAALTAAVVASRLGVAGTLIGTAVASIVAPVGAALYTLSIRKTHSRLQHLRPQQRGPSAEQVRRRPHLRGNWLIVAGSVVAVFIISMAAVTGVEAAAGKKLCAIVGGCSQGAGSGTTVAGLSGTEATPEPSPVATPGASNPPFAVPSDTTRPTQPASTATPAPATQPSFTPGPQPSSSP